MQPQTHVMTNQTDECFGDWLKPSKHVSANKMSSPFSSFCLVQVLDWSLPVASTFHISTAFSSGLLRQGLYWAGPIILRPSIEIGSWESTNKAFGESSWQVSPHWALAAMSFCPAVRMGPCAFGAKACVAVSMSWGVAAGLSWQPVTNGCLKEWIASK